MDGAYYEYESLYEAEGFSSSVFMVMAMSLCAAAQEAAVFPQLGACSPDGRRIVSASDDGTVWVWDVDTDTGKEIAQLIRFDGGEWLCFTPEGYTAFQKGDACASAPTSAVIGIPGPLWAKAQQR
jgi:hypothetical protein